MQGLKGVVIVATIVAATIALGGCYFGGSSQSLDRPYMTPGL